eukprot:TRINITY_DN14135_c0_g2_i1.p1 TRINITY_DN14135_c0_g2~~TRINITY_DN14135_c0_g2_i1.p1  ORF type:complete len:596 (+),score=105.19 TRINITY_DN14135_c0_g2_i1:64-1851(+)
MAQPRSPGARMRPRRPRLPAAIALATAAAAPGRLLVADSAVFHQFGESISVGCLAWDLEYTGLQPAAAATDVPSCQQLCASTADCRGFSFTFSSRSCRVDAGGSAPMVVQKKDGTVSGSRSCGAVPESCTALPDLHGSLASFASSMAAWPTGYQPQVLQCWARERNGDLAPCPMQVTVLEDVKTGWVGRCSGMTKVGDMPADACKQKCYEDPNCPAWAVANNNDCFHGIGDNCYTVDSHLAPPLAGQRIAHGSYRVLLELQTQEVKGLARVFDSAASAYLHQRGLDPLQACRNYCFSYTHCQFWQLRQSGCYIEMDTPNERLVPYPLTDRELKKNEGDPVIGGEFIQHLCPAFFTSAASQGSALASAEAAAAAGAAGAAGAASMSAAPAAAVGGAPQKPPPGVVLPAGGGSSGSVQAANRGVNMMASGPSFGDFSRRDSLLQNVRGSAVGAGVPQEAMCPDDHGIPLRPLPKGDASCPTNEQSAELKTCDETPPGLMCEGDGECGTNQELNNCGDDYDIYVKEGGVINGLRYWRWWTWLAISGGLLCCISFLSAWRCPECLQGCLGKRATRSTKISPSARGSRSYDEIYDSNQRY